MTEPSAVASSQLGSVTLSNQSTLTSNPAFGLGANRTPQIIIFASVTAFVLFHYDLRREESSQGVIRVPKAVIQVTKLFILASSPFRLCQNQLRNVVFALVSAKGLSFLSTSSLWDKP